MALTPNGSNGPGPVGGRPRPVVLIGFADALAAIEAAWSLRDAGHDVVAFARRGTRPALGRVRGVRLVEICPPERDADRARIDLAALVAALRPAVVLPLCDQSVWLSGQLGDQLGDEARDQGGHGDPGGDLGAAADVPVAGPTGAQARLALDKREQLRLAEKAGFLVPPSVETGPLADVPLPGPGPRPWIVKPALAVQERAGRLHRPAGRVAWDAGAARAIAAGIGGPVIVQPVLAGTGEGVFGMATGDGVVGWSAHRRVRMMNPAGSGSSACESIPVDPELRAAAERFVELAGWRGIFMIELLRDTDGRPYFMELNGRSWGSMALACRRGYDYPQWAVQARLDASFRPAEPVDAPDLTCRYLGGELIHLAFVLRGPGGRDSRAWPSRSRAVRELAALRRGHAWYNWRRGEPGVLLADTWFALRGQLARWRSR